MTDEATQTKIHRAESVTLAERYLKQLCDRAFLSLWSYSNLYRDQGIALSGCGKEVCDALVVFDNHIIIFSDKDCQFPNSGDLQTDWSRWFKQAILKSAKQVYGAERWIREFPTRLFLDRECTQSFPYPLPDPKVAKFHRIVVAHNVSDRCCSELGGSGSLMIHTDIVGEQHYARPDSACLPFAVGHIDPSKGFVHVLDDTTLEILLGTLDTITDFVTYLEKKEEFLTQDMIVMAPGEEELLAHYLSGVNEQDEHDFVLPAHAPKNLQFFTMDEGFWESFIKSEQRQRQIEADKISYLWDDLIERTTGHMNHGTQYFTVDPSVAYSEQLLRMLARASRFERRVLARSLLDLIDKTSPDIRNLRVITPLSPNGTYYVLLLFPERDGVTEERYRLVRREYLSACLFVTKLTFPDALDIVGVATETGKSIDRSEDIIYLNAREWTKDNEIEAKRVQKEYGILTHPTAYRAYDHEYPAHLPMLVPMKPTERKRSPRGSERNKPCPCGSGKKYKKCHGRPWNLPP